MSTRLSAVDLWTHGNSMPSQTLARWLCRSGGPWVVELMNLLAKTLTQSQVSTQTPLEHLRVIITAAKEIITNISSTCNYQPWAKKNSYKSSQFLDYFFFLKIDPDVDICNFLMATDCVNNYWCTN